MINKPLLFLAVDGVLSPLSVSDEKRGEFHEYSIHDSMLFREETIEFFKMVHQDDLAEVHWTTDWGRLARDVVAPAVGLPHWDKVRTAEEVATEQWWKEEVVKKTLAAAPIMQKYVWLEDEATEDNKRELEEEYPDRGLVVAPEADYGLADEDLVTIEEFLKQAKMGRRLRWLQ